MSRYTALAPGKVNLCLAVGRPREDGYHPLVSVVQPVSLADELTLEPHDGDEDVVVCPEVPGENLAALALARFREATGWDAPPQLLTIVKRVPIAAGMGGGSGDAAAALRLAALAAGRTGDPAITEIAAQLGADVPSQVEPQRVLMTGAGERVEPYPHGPRLPLVVLPSEHTLSTPAVYAEFDRLGLGRDQAELDRMAAEYRTAGRWPMFNDLEAAALSLCPAVRDALALLQDGGPRASAAAAMVSGSGPTVFAVVHDLDAARALAGRVPGAIVAEPVGPEFAAARAQ